MLKNLSSKDVAWILDQTGISLKRRSKKNVFAGYYGGKNRVVIVPRNKRSIPQGMPIRLPPKTVELDRVTFATLQDVPTPSRTARAHGDLQHAVS